MKKIFVFIAVAAVLCFIRPAAAALYDKGQPLFFQAQRTTKDHEKMLRGFDLVLKNELEAEGKATIDRGIRMFAQSPRYEYEQGKDFFIFLRFQPTDGRYPVRLDMLGSFKIEMIDMSRARVDEAEYVFDDDFKKKLVREGVDSVSLGSSETSVPEVNIIFNLGDFNFVPPADGIYRIRILYHSESPDNRIWTGTIASNPIIIKVGQSE